jgi:hypothetical protein
MSLQAMNAKRMEVCEKFAKAFPDADPIAIGKAAKVVTLFHSACDSMEAVRGRQLTNAELDLVLREVFKRVFLGGM